MSKYIETDRRANLVGSFWMVAAMAAFAVEDVFVKAASKTLPVGQILILFGLGGAFVFACVAIWNQQCLFTSDVVSRPMRLRVLFEILGRLFYVLAIALTPLSVATVILQATPIVVVAGAALVFGETVGWRRWIAILVGLAGVMMIVRPGMDRFSLLSVLAVLGMLGFAGRDLTSRAAPLTLSASVLGLYGFLAVVAAGALYSIWDATPFAWPTVQTTLLLLGAVTFGVVAYFGLMKAMRSGEVSAVTPFRYSRMLFGIAFGMILFDEQLSVSMLTGCGLIVVSGLFLLWRNPRNVRSVGQSIAME
ncbi:DMT family transporter [Novipirellula artificiosorum]|uniref:EamA-like transporter family protein n=1 Tax=Novipirellula artificiosorum TaxID=2528016 RepID=A0A5C6D686_9BACT|nr:DMT family transporter [Novipirellula artificiosorum]TWU31334.1 EamA-like transporter family protein [Novipirellula artificiosorum]